MRLPLKEAPAGDQREADRAQGVHSLPKRALLIGTRGSPLALWQAEHVRTLLVATSSLEEANIELRIITTSGDRVRDKPLRDFGGKGLFTKEIDEDLLGHKVDLAVHSMKDLPTVLPSGISVAAVLPRGDVRDAFISRQGHSLVALPPGAVVGSSSLRRQAPAPRPRYHRLPWQCRDAAREARARLGRRHASCACWT